MSTFKPHSLTPGLAALSARAPSSVAVLALDLAADANGWQQLLPAGRFSAIDGRPFDVPGGHWQIDADIAARLIAQAQAAANDLVIDYEHQTLYSETNGQPAPAAAWFKDMEWREGSGLWIRPQWTSRARDHIQNGEYKYLSAVFSYDKDSGTPLLMHSAALVNRPGIDGLQALEALSARINRTPTHPASSPPNEQEQHPMNEALRQLLAKLGIEIAADASLTDEQGTAALAALSALQGQATQAKALETEVAALKAGAGSAGAQAVDLSKYVPAATYNALVTEMATLKAGSDQTSVEQLLKDARSEGRVLASEQDYLEQFAAQQGVAALKSLIEARPAVVALRATQTHDKVPPKDKAKDDDLSAEDLAVLKATGLSKADFLKSKQELN
uniref:phage protease n=1 Tax=Marinobacterium profundum TaxID=1714300 RepID=UPI000836E9DA|nr:phage protease [Marinobacterium profundum]